MQRKSVIIENFLRSEILPLDSRIAFRGLGFIWGLDFSAFGQDMAKPLMAECFKNGLIVERVGRNNNVLKLMPALTIKDGELLKGLEILKKSTAGILA